MNLESMKQSYTTTINELNQQLLAMKDKSEQNNGLLLFLSLLLIHPQLINILSVLDLLSSSVLAQTSDEVCFV